MLQLPAEVKDYIDNVLQNNQALREDYTTLRQAVAQRFGIKVSQYSISRLAARLNIKVPRGRKEIFSTQKRSTHNINIACAGAFFLKGAELETGILTTINQLLGTKSESLRARRTLRLAQEINAYLLYLPLAAGVKIQTLNRYIRRGILFLTGQKRLPARREIEQYFHFLDEQNLLSIMVKEIEKNCAETLQIRVENTQGAFYLDGQGRTVWPAAQLPQAFTATLSKTIRYIDRVFIRPSVRRALALQAVPGDAFLPPEVFNLIQCFEQEGAAGTCRLSILDKLGNRVVPDTMGHPTSKKYFILPLNPQQLAQCCKMHNIQGYQQTKIGSEEKMMRIADAQAELFKTPQHTEFITLRAVIVEREGASIILVTNIPYSAERYAKKIVEQHYCHWPPVAGKSATYTNLLEETQRTANLRQLSYLLPLLEAQKTDFAGKEISSRFYYFFQLLLECLHRYVQFNFFLSGDEEHLDSAADRIYQQGGYMKVKQMSQEIYLYSFQNKELQQIIAAACRNFNQSVIELPSQKMLRIFMA